MLYLIDSIVTITGYGELKANIYEIDERIAIGMLLYHDFASFLHYRGLEKLRKKIKILDLINQDPLISAPPDVKDGDEILYYDISSDLFYMIEVLSPVSV